MNRNQFFEKWKSELEVIVEKYTKELNDLNESELINDAKIEVYSDRHLDGLFDNEIKELEEEQEKLQEKKGETSKNLSKYRRLLNLIR